MHKFLIPISLPLLLPLSPLLSLSSLPPSFISPLPLLLPLSIPVYRHFRTLAAQIEEDEIAMTGLVEDRQQFLEKALHNYIHCLRTGVSLTREQSLLDLLIQINTIWR